MGKTGPSWGPRRQSTGEDASFYFQRFDSNGSGKIDVQEFGSLLLSLNLLKPGHGDARRSAAHKALRSGSPESHEIVASMAAAKELGPELLPNKEWLYEQFFQADFNGDGLLSFEEFRGYWERAVLPRLGKFEDLYTEQKGAIGRGAFGEVRRATQVSSGREVAIKHISKYEAEMIHAEIAIWEGLHHPHLLELIDVHETENQCLLITEIMPGGDLLGALSRLGKHVTERQVLGLAWQIISAVAYLHSHGVVHCDLKPSNILVLERTKPKASKPSTKPKAGLVKKSPAKVAPAPPPATAAAKGKAKSNKLASSHLDIFEEEPVLTIKVADFGLSQLRPSAGQAAAGLCSPHPTRVSRMDSAEFFNVQGTYEYFAPELARLALKKHVGLLPKGYGPAVDDWAIGCILFEMLVGDPPFGDRGNEQCEQALFQRIIDADINAVLKRAAHASSPTSALLRQLLTRDPHERLRAADALALKEVWAPLSPQSRHAAADKALPTMVAKRRKTSDERRQRAKTKMVNLQEASTPPIVTIPKGKGAARQSLPSRVSQKASKVVARVLSIGRRRKDGPEPISVRRGPSRLRDSIGVYVEKAKYTLRRAPGSVHTVEENGRVLRRQLSRDY